MGKQRVYFSAAATDWDTGKTINVRSRLLALWFERHPRYAIMLARLLGRL